MTPRGLHTRVPACTSVYGPIRASSVRRERVSSVRYVSLPAARALLAHRDASEMRANPLAVLRKGFRGSR